MHELVAATSSDKALFSALVRLYSYDFTEVNGWSIDAHGEFPYIPCFDEMWTDENRFPFIIRSNSENAGFALVHRTGAGEFDMEQFFVLRKFRRCGCGTAAAQDVFQRFPGKWTVEQTANNIGAQLFWRKTIGGWTNDSFEEIGTMDPMQSFISGGQPVDR